MSTLRATGIFWLSLTVGGAVAGGIDVVFFGGAGGPEWGGVSGTLVLGTVLSAIAAVPASGFHAAAVFLLRRLFPAIAPSINAASSALSAVAVVAVGIAVAVLAPKEADWPILVVIGPLPFVLTLLVVPLVGRLKRPDARQVEEASHDS